MFCTDIWPKFGCVVPRRWTLGHNLTARWHNLTICGDRHKSPQIVKLCQSRQSPQIVKLCQLCRHKTICKITKNVQNFLCIFCVLYRNRVYCVIYCIHTGGFLLKGFDLVESPSYSLINFLFSLSLFFLFRAILYKLDKM